MKIGVIGLPQTGKKTLFGILTNRKPTENEIISKQPIKGVVEVRDPRFDMLAKIYKPKKEARARIEIDLLPKLEKDTTAEGGIFTDINELDAICHVVRAFKDESIYHVEGSVDPKRDIDSVNSELILHDLVFIEKRMENIEKKAKKLKDESVVKEKALLVKLKAHLEKELPLRLVGLTPEESKIISGYPFVTRKTVIVALNISEEDLNNRAQIDQLKRDCQAAAIDIMQISAKVESEIANLESEEEREQFLKELGIKEPARDALSRLCIKALNLISFFTVGPDEVRQWTARSGSTAPEAAGVVHTDLQKGFIRADVIKYSDFAIYGSEAKVKEAGKRYVKGKDYIVEDGDMLDIRFNV